MGDLRGSDLHPDYDALINERLLGYHWINYPWYDGTIKQLLWHDDMGQPRGDDFGRLSDGRLFSWDMDQPSTDLVSAWAMVEAVYARHGAWMQVGINPDFLQNSRRPGRYVGSIHGGNVAYKRPECNHYAFADSPALALCRAACEALGIEVKA